jgi:hypothetical protein
MLTHNIRSFFPSVAGADGPGVAGIMSIPLALQKIPLPKTKPCQFCSLQFTTHGIVSHMQHVHPQECAASYEIERAAALARRNPSVDQTVRLQQAREVFDGAAVDSAVDKLMQDVVNNASTDPEVGTARRGADNRRSYTLQTKVCKPFSPLSTLYLPYFMSFRIVLCFSTKKPCALRTS